MCGVGEAYVWFWCVVSVADSWRRSFSAWRTPKPNVGLASACYRHGVGIGVIQSCERPYIVMTSLNEFGCHQRGVAAASF